MYKPEHSKIAVTQVQFLQPGWVLAINNGKLEATRVDVPRGNTHIFANTILDRLEKLRASATVGGIFMTEEDCSLITEHFPDVFYKNKI